MTCSAGSRRGRARSRRAGSTTGAGPNCSRRSPICPNIIRLGRKPRSCRRVAARIAAPGRSGAGGGGVRLGFFDQDTDPAAGGGSRSLCADRHFGRFPARVLRAAGWRRFRRLTVLPLEADFMRPIALPPHRSRRYAQARFLSRDRRSATWSRSSSVDLLRAMKASLGEGCDAGHRDGPDQGPDRAGGGVWRCARRDGGVQPQSAGADQPRA